MRPLVVDRRGVLERVSGVALASRLADRRVSQRMAAAAREVLAAEGISPEIDECNDTTTAQPGAAFALVAEFDSGARLGADRAGASRRSAERIGRRVAHRVEEDIRSGVTLDRFAADQLLPFMAMADGESTCRIAAVTEHVATGAWLAFLFLGAEVLRAEGTLWVAGRSPPRP